MISIFAQNRSLTLFPFLVVTRQSLCFPVEMTESCLEEGRIRGCRRSNDLDRHDIMGSVHAPGDRANARSPPELTNVNISCRIEELKTHSWLQIAFVSA
jgi:hypothetical protein